MNILFLGRFDPRNGLGTMIDAFIRVRREWGPDVRLVVVGDGPLRTYYQKRVPDSMHDDVYWAGRVDWERPNYYTSADVHCTPCNRASFGMVLLEAMSCGRPVVASRISGFQLVMEHGKHGLMIHPADDATRFAEALLYQLDRPAERARMGREGRRTAVTRYAWPKVARAARGLLSGTDARAALRRELTKRQTLVRYVLFAVLGAAVTAGLDATVVAAGIGPVAWLIDVAFASALILFTFATFSPNAPLFGRVIDGAGVHEPVVAITFDDGPSPDTTPRVLDALRAADARATFFVLGRHAEQHPEIVQRIAREGHELANHTYGHGILVFASQRDITRELLRTAPAAARLGQSPAAPVPRAARLPEPVRGACRSPARVPRRGLDEGRLRHRPAGRRRDCGAEPEGAPPGRDPAAP